MNLNTVLATMGREMKKKYGKYWGNTANINQFLYVGVIFDPHFKLRYMEWSCSDMYSDQQSFANQLSGSLKDNLFKMDYWYKSAFEQQTGSSSSGPQKGISPADTSTQAETESLNVRRDAFKQHLREQDSINEKNELERYLRSEPCIDEGDKFDILLWWKQNSSRYPILSTIVRDVLATPVSTQRVHLALGGTILDTYRSSLNPEMAEGLICAQNWLKPSIYQLKDLNINEEFEVSETILTGSNYID